MDGAALRGVLSPGRGFRCQPLPWWCPDQAAGGYCGCPSSEASFIRLAPHGLPWIAEQPLPISGLMGQNLSLFRGPLVLWDFSFSNPVKNLSQKLQGNKFFPFQVQQPRVFVMEYYKDMLWKGSLLFVSSLVASVFYFRSEMGSQNFSGFFIYGMTIGLWLIASNMNKRRLIINHNKGLYQFYIKGCLWQEGPLYQIYVRLVAQRDAYGKLFYSLIINGYRLEVLTLANLSSKFEQIDILGRRVARNLNLNYFDYEDISMRHVIRHRPPEPKEEEDEDLVEDQIV
ncbi:cation channel sperm-associated auxiliary subunit TMEM249 isoform X2 [Paroedura picta]|uniref:cation channel sperm-associated auxiliary subunit TMEM249 isoform X2 n=1 Tax=Paroedura picta TaxID=143630 RepID=UPI004056C68B